jgi:hypothetical protein
MAPKDRNSNDFRLGRKSEFQKKQKVLKYMERRLSPGSGYIPTLYYDHDHAQTFAGADWTQIAAAPSSNRCHFP